jgi:hypothetical protein
LRPVVLALLDVGVSLWFDKPQAVDIPFDHFAGCISAGINCNVDTMRIALVVDERTNLWHSVLIVNIAGQILVLDNREASVRPAADFSHFRPLMAMNENWWELADQRLRQPVSASAPTANLSAPPPRPAHRPAGRRPSDRRRVISRAQLDAASARRQR